MQTRREKNGQKKREKSIFMRIERAESGTLLCLETAGDVPGGHSVALGEVREVCHSEQSGHVRKDYGLAC